MQGRCGRQQDAEGESGAADGFCRALGHVFRPFRMADKCERAASLGMRAAPCEGAGGVFDAIVMGREAAFRFHGRAMEQLSRSKKQSVTAAPTHMETSAVQPTRAKTDPPVTPAPTAQPPASMPPKPMRAAPAI